MQSIEVQDQPTDRQARPARLTVWEGGERSAEYELDPAHVTTIGRHPICDIALNDSLCSRQHSEIFLSGTAWVVRDLGSRNGTFVDKNRIEGDWSLEHRQVIHVGSSALVFMLERPDLPEGSEVDTVFLMDTHKGMLGVSGEHDASILSEVERSRYRLDAVSDERQGELAHGLSHLHRMAIQTASAADRKSVAEIVLESVLDATHADIGAVLMLDQRPSDETDGLKLRQFAFRSRTERAYESVSASLSQKAVEENRAVLAHYILDGPDGDALPQTPDSIAELQARSVICAPIRCGKTTCGLLHIYSTSLDRNLEEDDLHLTLAAADHLALVSQSLAEKEDLAQQLADERSKTDALRKELARDSLLVGESPSIVSLREEAHRIAPTDATVLIRGESGVGKELVARTIHDGSRRKGKQFVCMNCAALTESLLESELFGHEKGSFTGATEQKQGKFEQADGGTLFLDEVGEMSLSIQAKFLRVLEGHPFERVGGDSPIRVDVRVVAATNRDLEDAVNAGLFRQDLYFRLHVVQMLIDPLRDRTGDIPILANHFLRRIAEKSGLPRKELTSSAMQKLSEYAWHGNVRELQNTMERALIMSDGFQIDADDIRLSALDGSDSGVLAYNRTPQGQFREMSLAALEHSHIMATLKHTEWNKTRAAEILGIERSTLDRKLKRAGISRPTA